MTSRVKQLKHLGTLRQTLLLEVLPHRLENVTFRVGQLEQVVTPVQTCLLEIFLQHLKNDLSGGTVEHLVIFVQTFLLEIVFYRLEDVTCCVKQLKHFVTMVQACCW